MAKPDSERSSEQLISDSAPSNGQMEVDSKGRVQVIQLCAICVTKPSTIQPPVRVPAMKCFRDEKTGKLVPVCRIHGTEYRCFSFQEVWDEWCVQLVHDS